MDQLAAGFPNREAMHAAIDVKIQAPTPYKLTGYYAESGQIQKGKDRIEQAVRLTPGLMHQSLV